MLVQKLTLFESKLDMVLSRLATPAASVAPAPKPALTVVVPSSALVQNKPLRPVRQMYEVVCADCKQDCSVPFKPRADSPVYCKVCFSKRKATGPVKPELSKPKQESQPVGNPSKVKPLKLISKNKPQPNTNKAKKK
ncbi:MAG: hypothetical protein KJ915_01605 [Candidatus Omnitrophica bacterium]|nr:hypothetical protein [Candidatus Omnitrophota bacterium]